MKKKIGFIGLGHQGLERIDLVMSIKKLEIVGLADTNIELIMMPDKLKNIPKFNDYKLMLNEVSIDIVWICVPHHLHQEISKHVLYRKIDIIKEKPFAIDLKNGVSILNEALQDKKTIFTIMQRREHASYIEGRKLLNQIGNVILVDAKYTFNGEPFDYAWRGKIELSGGGAIIDMGYHMIDLLVWYLGVPSVVKTVMTNRSRLPIKYETEDSAVINFQYESGLLGSLFLSRATGPKEEKFIFYGTKGILTVSRNKVIVIDQNNSILFEKEYDSNWEESIRRHLYLFLKNKDMGLMNMYDQLDDLLFVEKCYMSSAL